MVKNEFKFENGDLDNDFSAELMPNLEGEVTFDDVGFAVHNAEGQKIFSIIPTTTTEHNWALEIIIFACYLLGFLFFFSC